MHPRRKCDSSKSVRSISKRPKREELAIFHFEKPKPGKWHYYLIIPIWQRFRSTTCAFGHKFLNLSPTSCSYVAVICNNRGSALLQCLFLLLLWVVLFSGNSIGNYWNNSHCAAGAILKNGPFFA